MADNFKDTTIRNAFVQKLNDEELALALVEDTAKRESSGVVGRALSESFAERTRLLSS